MGAWFAVLAAYICEMKGLVGLANDHDVDGGLGRLGVGTGVGCK
jgi:hypothetical protein